MPRLIGGTLPSSNTSASYVWSLTEVTRAVRAALWPTHPSAPTNVVAGPGNEAASVAFDAPESTGGPDIISYRVTSTPGNFTATGSSSPITVTGLTNGTQYTFKVEAANILGYGPESDASNSVTPGNAIAGQEEFTTPGSYSFVAPDQVSAVSVVAVGGGSGGGNVASPANLVAQRTGGGGGGLGWINDYPVTPGCSYTVVVGAGGLGPVQGGDSYFVSPTVVKGGGGGKGPGGLAGFGPYTGTGGGCGGCSADTYGGGGAGGYSGNGGNGGPPGAPAGAKTGCDGAGGGAGGGSGTWNAPCTLGGGGGGVGLCGEGASGTGGTIGPSSSPGRASNQGGGGSGGAGGALETPAGALYGGGGAGSRRAGPSRGGVPTCGQGGAVRVIWSGVVPSTGQGIVRGFPNNNTGDV